MSHPLVTHRIERLLASAFERLTHEFPSLPAGVISRCVEAARVAVPTHPRQLVDIVDAIERTAREDLTRIAAALSEVPKRVVNR